MNKVKMMAAAALISFSMLSMAQDTQQNAPSNTAPATQFEGAPLTKDQMKAQKKEQKHAEKAAKENAKAAKAQADAVKHQDKAKDEQEKTQAHQPQ